MRVFLSTMLILQLGCTAIQTRSTRSDDMDHHTAVQTRETIEGLARRFVSIYDSGASQQEETLRELLDEECVLYDNHGNNLTGRDAVIAVMLEGLKHVPKGAVAFREEYVIRSVQSVAGVIITSGDLLLVVDGERKNLATMTLVFAERSDGWRIVHETIIFE